ncbi:MAG: hypothetical protein RL398_1126, partial [Planctomycetota bacterium]
MRGGTVRPTESRGARSAARDAVGAGGCVVPHSVDRRGESIGIAGVDARSRVAGEFDERRAVVHQ